MNVPAYGTSDQSVTETSVFLFCWQITTTLGCPIKDLVLPNSEHNSSTKIKTAGCRARKLPIAISSGRAHRQCGNATWYVHIYGPHPHIGLRSLSPGKGSLLMFTYYEYRKKALRYGELAKTAPAAKQESEFRALEERFMRLADNEEWLSRNHGKNVSAADTDQPEVVTLAKQEEHILRCLGAALILQWNTLPKKLQRELFDNAGSMGELMETAKLRANIARFLHKHKTMRTRESGMPKVLLSIPRLSTAEKYRKRASAVSAQLRQLRNGDRRTKLLDMAWALTEQADNYDWLDGKTKPDGRHQVRRRPPATIINAS
jgi:hypothetical protein